MLVTDEVLKKANRLPLFGSFLDLLVNGIFPENLLRKIPELSTINKTLDQMVINHISGNEKNISPIHHDSAFRMGGESGIGSEIFENISNLISSYTEFLDTLSTVQLGALSNLIFTFLLLSCLISLIFIFFSDYFIKRLDFTNYPRIKKFLDLRSKFQVYYFIINALMIFGCGLALLFVNVSLFLNF